MSLRREKPYAGPLRACLWAAQVLVEEGARYAIDRARTEAEFWLYVYARQHRWTEAQIASVYVWIDFAFPHRFPGDQP